MNSQMKRYVHRMKSEKVLSTGSAVPVELGWELEAPETAVGIFMGAFSCRHDQFTPFPAPLPSLENLGLVDRA